MLINKIDFYIIKKIFFIYITITSVFSLIVWLIQSLRFLDTIVNYNLPLSSFLSFVAYLLPDLWVMLSPITFALSAVIVFSRLSSTHELGAMKALGINFWGVGRSTVISSVAVAVFLLSLSLYFVPLSFKKFRDKQYLMQNILVGHLMKEGRFNSSKNFTIHINEQQKNGEIKGFYMFQKMNDKLKEKIVTAQSGKIIHDNNRIIIQLNEGHQFEKDDLKKRQSTTTFDALTLDVSEIFTLAQKKRDDQKPSELFIEQLLNPNINLIEDIKRKFKVEAHQRILIPLMTILNICLALWLSLTTEYQRHKQQTSFKIMVFVFIQHLILIMSTSLGLTIDSIHLPIYGLYVLLTSFFIYKLIRS